MRFTKMENGIPKRENFKLKPRFDEFIALNVKVVRVDLDEEDYKSPTVAANVLRISAKRWAVPVKVVLSEGEVYFVRKDM